MSTTTSTDRAAWLSSLTRSLTAVSRHTHSPALYSRMAEKAGLSLRAHLVGVLFRVAELQPVRISEVAETMAYDRSTISRHVAELGEEGLVDRSPDPDDGRAVIVRLSRRGASAVNRIQQAWYQTLEELTAGWSERERSTFLRQLDRFDEALTALDED
jgi:DNA-binding MarR family transcriptional regulator